MVYNPKTTMSIAAPITLKSPRYENTFVIFTTGIVHATKCIVVFYKHIGILKNMREVLIQCITQKCMRKMFAINFPL